MQGNNATKEIDWHVHCDYCMESTPIEDTDPHAMKDYLEAKGWSIGEYWLCEKCVRKVTIIED